jgi:homocysteine S-methyltransferase
LDTKLFEKALLRDGAIILDGGLATQLEAQGCDIGTRLWSAEMLRSNPSAIIDAHRAYLDAGAEVIISASYQASRQGFMALGLSEQEADDLVVSSVELACIARQQFLDAHPETGDTPIVAASIGPYGAALHDGSEYTGDYDIDEAGLRRFHAHRLALLEKTEADVLACETMPNRMEAKVLHDLLMGIELPAWVSFSCCDARCISDGTSLRHVSAMFRDHPRVLALGINCTAPQLVTPLIGEITKGAPDKSIVVYPNSGETYEVRDNSWHGAARPTEYAAEARRWLQAGAKVIGGCCRIGPQQIGALRECLTR